MKCVGNKMYESIRYYVGPILLVSYGFLLVEIGIYYLVFTINLKLLFIEFQYVEYKLGDGLTTISNIIVG